MVTLSSLRARLETRNQPSFFSPSKNKSEKGYSGEHLRQVGRFTRVAMEKRGGADTAQKYTGSQEFMVKDHEFVLVLHSMVG